MRAIDFRGFRFGKVHSSDLNLEVVSTSNKYENRVLPAPTDTTVDIPGGDGQYYFGSIYKNREITVNVAFENVSEQIYRKIRQLFATDKPQDLVFDEEPYKTWKAKLKSKPDFKSLCFTDKETGERVYKGDGKLTFICYYPYAFGFDKYVVRAADYYMLNPPECIINEAYSDETFVKNNKNKDFKALPEDTKYHYNTNPSDYEGNTDKLRDKSHRNKLDRGWEPNDKLPWKTGFPTPEQVQAGELFFDTKDGEKAIVDVRGYWDNIPEWEGTAKLLTTPTLDFDQELMYLPQYSKTDFINMELGFMNSRPMIGTRMLVYNPGDLPVDWEIRFDENKRSFWSCRGGTKFKIKRFNVERLQLEDAVDWCGLTTYNMADNEPYKYGNRYFRRRCFNRKEIIERIKTRPARYIADIQKPRDEQDIYTSTYYTRDEIVDLIRNGELPADKYWYSEENGDMMSYPYSKTQTIGDMTDGEASNYTTLKADKVSFNLHLDNILWKDTILSADTLLPLKDAHPHHCYYVEPIPREKLGHYIKLFYWQTIQWRGDQLPTGEWVGTTRWMDMLPEGMITLEGEPNNEGVYSKVIFNGINQPLMDFLSSFLVFSFDEDTGILSAQNRGVIFREIYKDLDYEKGIEFANRYDELRAECIDEYEEYELYWKTLKDLLREFAPMFKHIYHTEKNIEKAINDFIDSYINHPAEFIGSDLRDLDYADDIFNGYKMPEWMTQDYIEIDQSLLSGVAIIKQYLEATGEDPDSIFNGKRVRFTNDKKKQLEESGNYAKLIRTLENTIGIGGYLNDLLDDYYYLNTDTRMLYTTANPYGMEFVYKPNKVVMNEAITKGKWFKLPPGWSLICIEPVVDESLWGGKRWEDSRPFDWGYGGDLNRNKREVQQLYDAIYDMAKEEFFKIYPEEEVQAINPSANRMDNSADELLKFKTWYEDKIEKYKPLMGTLPFSHENNYFIYSFYSKLKTDGEYEFLKIINSIWGAIAPYFKWTSLKGVWSDPSEAGHDAPTLEDYDITGLPLRCINADISDWWQYACNYLWANFPPLYWAVADMLNRIQIKYTPLFY